MYRYICTACRYSYDPFTGDTENAIEPGTPFHSLPEDWVCPHCGAEKDDFIGVEESVHRMDHPNKPLQIEEEHTPFYTVGESSVAVRVGTDDCPHENGTDHAVLFVALVDEDGEILQLK